MNLKVDLILLSGYSCGLVEYQPQYSFLLTLFREEPQSGVLHRLREVLRHAVNQSDAVEDEDGVASS
jgi:hypothetical protein